MITMMPTYKVVMIGEGGCGKTSLAHRVLTGEYDKKYIPTIGVDVRPLKMTIRSRRTNKITNVCLNIWDTAGLDNSYYADADAAILCVSSVYSSSEIIDLTKTSVKNFRKICPVAPIILALTKIDHRDAVTVSTEANRIDANMIIETSACFSFQIYEPFVAALRTLLDDKTLIFVEIERPIPLTVNTIINKKPNKHAYVAEELPFSIE